MNILVYLFLETDRFFKSMPTDGFISACDFLDNEVEAGMG
jgi:hypothetical protein